MSRKMKPTINDDVKCEVCGSDLLPVYGWMWTQDSFLCPERDCDFVIDLETSTVPDDSEW